MKVLSQVTPTSEQLTIISNTKFGTEIIRGCAGSGKTTTAILRLKSLANVFAMRRMREHSNKNIKGLILTYNRTLRGYIGELCDNQVSNNTNVNLNISTFSKWAISLLGYRKIINNNEKKVIISSLSKEINLEDSFLLDEIDYVMGRFLPNELEKYITCTRNGRGATPRVDKNLREKIIEDIIYPYKQYLKSKELYDWNDLATELATNAPEIKYDFIITDETQDFSANQLRAITSHLEDISCLTFVLDTAQRIYARGFTWHEAGINIRPENSKRLTINYRNTKEIALFASKILPELKDDDATIPSANDCVRTGDKPIIISGSFLSQAQYIIDFIKKTDINNESIGILHPLGGKWFDDIKHQLSIAGYGYTSISKEEDWPKYGSNIALSTMHSSKGLEFDHVIIIGMTNETITYKAEDDEDKLDSIRRLIAMSITRARNTVTIGLTLGDRATVFDYFEKETYQEIAL